MTDKTLVSDSAATQPGSQDAPTGASSGALLTPTKPVPSKPAPADTARPVPPVPPIPPQSSTPDQPQAPRQSSNFAWLVILLVLLCVALGGAIWYQRQQVETTGMAVAGRIDALSAELNAARSDMREALSLAQSQSTKLVSLETAIRESQAEYSTLEQAWQDFNDTTNDGVLANDVERLLTIASQQLRLGGSVSNAIVALESAQSRLARADRPRFANLQQAVNGDVDRLRAVPIVDVAAQSARIEHLSGLVSRAPLLVPDAALADAKTGDTTVSTSANTTLPSAADIDPVAADAPWWQHWRAEMASWPTRAGSVIAHEMGDLIKVQRADQPGALLLSANQSDQLRATLRQRLQTVQLALLMRQSSVWKNELGIVVRTLNDYYDPRSVDTQAALRLTEALAEIPVATVLPEINDSLNAMATVKSEASTQTERN